MCGNFNCNADDDYNLKGGIACVNTDAGDVDGAAGKKGKWARTQCEFDSANSFIEGVPKIEPFDFPEPECSADIEQRCEDLFVDLDEDGNNRFAPCLAQVRKKQY